MATIPLINGVRYSFASIELNVNGTIYRGVKEISYSQKLEPSPVRGTPAQPIGFTLGEYSCEASMTMYMQEWRELLEALGDGFGMIPFTIVVQYWNVGQDVKTDTLVGCRIKGVENSHSQGTDALTNKIDLQPSYMLENDKSIVPGLMR